MVKHEVISQRVSGHRQLCYILHHKDTTPSLVKKKEKSDTEAILKYLNFGWICNKVCMSYVDQILALEKRKILASELHLWLNSLFFASITVLSS